MEMMRRAWPAVLAVVLLTACESGGGTSVPKPAAVAATTPLTQSAIVSTAVAAAPAVRVTDKAGTAMAGVAVTFAVTAGGGTIGTAAAVTDASGVATSGTWTLGAAAGANAVTATVTGLPPVTFNATAVARTPASVTAASATTQTARTGTAVPQAPAVLVRDQTGQPLPGVSVTFVVSAGGGQVASGTAVTSATGVATSGSWTLGATAGQNTVTATVAGLAPVVFTATGTTPAADPCTVITPLALLTTISGQLASTDCRLSSGEYEDFYSVNLPSAQTVAFSMSSSAFDTYLDVFDAAGRIIAINDDATESTTNSTVRLFAPSGGYIIGASSFDPNRVGAYQLSSAAFSGNTGCDEYWVVPGLSITGQLASSDCVFGNVYRDDYLIVLRAGETITLRLESTGLDPVLDVYNAAGAVVATDNNSGGGTTARLSYTAPATNIYIIVARAATTATSGPYTLTVTRP